MIGSCLLMALFLMAPYPSAPADSAALSQASITGRTQLEVILRDRPQMAAILMDREAIRAWLVEELGTENPQPLWDPAEPVSGRAAEHEYPSRGGAAPAGTAVIRVSSRPSGWDQLAGLIFELHNLRRSARFEAIHEAAVSGAIDESEYVRRSLQQEFAALLATRRFLAQHVHGMPEDAREGSPLFEQILETADSLEAHLEEQRDKGVDLETYFEELYEQEVVPERRGSGSAER
ncbi:MAG TPA: hypothetical protein VFG91_09325 [Woeseiaceae bacterium]|nr:hypothetical protein [Woeseiaceae bacterium]